jgi:hypothetical protein
MRLNFGVRRRGTRAGAEARARSPALVLKQASTAASLLRRRQSTSRSSQSPFCTMCIARPDAIFYCAASADSMHTMRRLVRQVHEPGDLVFLTSAENAASSPVRRQWPPRLRCSGHGRQVDDQLLRCCGRRHNAAGAHRRSRQAAEPPPVPPQHPIGRAPEVQHRTRTPGRERRRPAHASARKPLSARHFA